MMRATITRQRRRSARIGLVVLALGGAGVAACGGDDDTASRPERTEEGATAPATAASTPAAGTGAAVTIKGFLFKPNPLEVETGTEVSWTNEDQILHTVTSGTPDSRTGTFDLTFPERGAVAAFTFAEPGSYTYFCNRHNSMTGTVVVS